MSGIIIVICLVVVLPSCFATAPERQPRVPGRVAYEVSGDTLRSLMNGSRRFYSSSGGGNSLVNSDGDSNAWQSSEDSSGSSSVTFPREGGSSDGDLAVAADGYTGNIGWPDDKGLYNTAAKNPVKGYGYLKGWGWGVHPHTFGGHHGGHHHHHHLGWPSLHHSLGWGYGNGWNGDNLHDIGHHWLDTLYSWFGLKATGAGATLVTLFKYVIIAVPIAAIIILIVLFLPIPAIVTPAICSRAASNSRLWNETERVAKAILTSDECIERISCKLARATRKFDGFSAIDRILSHLPNSSIDWINRAVVSMRAARNVNSTEESADTCGHFSCDPFKQLKLNLRSQLQS